MKSISFVCLPSSLQGGERKRNRRWGRLPDVGQQRACVQRASSSVASAQGMHACMRALHSALLYDIA